MNKKKINKKDNIIDFPSRLSNIEKEYSGKLIFWKKYDNLLI